MSAARRCRRCRCRRRSSTMQRACVAITGANGSIGPKLARYLLGVRANLASSSDGSGLSSARAVPLHLKLLDDYDGFHAGRAPHDPRAAEFAFPGLPAVGDLCGSLEHTQADCLEPGGAGLVKTLSDVDSVVHLAAVNPCVRSRARAPLLNGGPRSALAAGDDDVIATQAWLTGCILRNTHAPHAARTPTRTLPHA